MSDAGRTLMLDDDAPPPMPCNIDAEQALLGILLTDNAGFERVPDGFKPDAFFEPFHSRLFDAIAGLIRKGHLAEAIVLTERFRQDPAFEDLGGLRYLADLVDRAPPTPHAGDYARELTDLALKREVIRLGEAMAYQVRQDPATEGREHVEAAEAQLYRLAETGQAQGGLVEFKSALTGAVNQMAEAYGRDGGLSGLSTGLMDLDQKLGGLHPSDLVIIAARPSMGKTTLATNIAFHVARTYAYEQQADGARKTTAGGRAAFFSLEMSGEQLAMRILAETSKVGSDKMRRGEISPTEFGLVRDAAMEIEAAPLHVDDTGGLRIDKMAARARRMKRQGGLDLIVVDYLQLVTAVLYQGQGRVQEVSEITQGLKALAKELAVPVIALSQLSRQVEHREDKRPMLSDLRESGSIEQDADVVMFLYREAYYLERAEPKDGGPEHLDWQAKMDECRYLADVIIAKQRHGPIGTVKLGFDPVTTKFSNLSRGGYGR